MPITLYTEEDIAQKIREANRAFAEKISAAIRAIEPDLSATAKEYHAAVSAGYQMCAQTAIFRIEDFVEELSEEKSPAP